MGAQDFGPKGRPPQHHHQHKLFLHLPKADVDNPPPPPPMHKAHPGTALGVGQ